MRRSVDPASSLHEKIHLAVIQVITGAHHADLARCYRLGERRLGGAQSLYCAADVLTDSGIEQLFFLESALSSGLQDSGNDGLDHLADAPGVNSFFYYRDPRLDSTAAFMAQHQNQRCSQNLNRVLDAAHSDGIYGVAGIADDKQLTQPGVNRSSGATRLSEQPTSTANGT
jgi:hypothetical protein